MKSIELWFMAAVVGSLIFVQYQLHEIRKKLDLKEKGRDEADTPDELAEAAQKLNEPPVLKVDAKELATLTRQIGCPNEATRGTCEAMPASCGKRELQEL